nr:Unknown Function [uncultured bacterium]
MESNPNQPVPVAALQYESESHVKTIDIVTLIAKWCIVLGALGIAMFGLQFYQLLSLYRVGANISAYTNIWLGIAVEIANVVVAAVLIWLGIGVMRGGYRMAERLWVALTAVIAVHLVLFVATMLRYRQIGSSGMEISMLLSVSIRSLTNCLPAAILLTIMRQRDVRNAMKRC